MDINRTSVYAVGAVFAVLPLPFVAMRFWARSIARLPLGVDDYLIIPATVFAMALGIILIIGAAIGQFGQHQIVGPDGMPIHNQPWINYEKLRFCVELLSTTVLGFTKLSFLFLYRRIFTPRGFRWTCDSLIIIQVAWTIAFFFATLLQCRPISTNWTLFEYQYTQPQCVNILQFYIAISVTDVIIDVALFILPIPMVWGLQMPMKQKLSVLGMFFLGTLVIAASVGRLVIFVEISRALTFNFHNAFDVTWLVTPSFVWSSIEASLSVICVCLPTIRPVFMRYASTTKNYSLGYSDDPSPLASRNWKPTHRRLHSVSPAGERLSLVNLKTQKAGSDAGTSEERPYTGPEGRGIWVRREIEMSQERQGDTQMV